MNVATPTLLASSALPAIDPAAGARGLYIGGHWVRPAGRQSIPVVDPSSGAVLAEVPRRHDRGCQGGGRRGSRGSPGLAGHATAPPLGNLEPLLRTDDGAH